MERGWRKLWVAVVVCAALLCLAAPAAQAAPGDAAATLALGRATDALLRAARPDLPKGLAVVKRYANEVAAQCPKAAAGSPQNYGAEQLDNEVVGAMTVVGYRTASAPIGAFYRAVKGLHWSNAKLTRAVARYATKLYKLVALTPPSLCTDVKEWAASGYNTLTASTTGFLKGYNANDPEAEEGPLILRLVKPFTTPADRSLIHSVENFEEKLAETEAHAVFAYKHLMNTLELNQ